MTATASAAAVRAAARLAPAGDRDRRPGPAIFDGVVDQVLEQLGQLVAVALHGRQRGEIGVGLDARDRRRRAELDRHAPLGRAECERGRETAEHGADIHAAGRRRVLVELDPRQRQQVGDEPRHALGLFAA